MLQAKASALDEVYTSGVTPSNILEFWFSKSVRPKWFEKDEAFDRQLREQFEGVYESATMGAFQAWESQPKSMLALIIVLDQFPRNIYRGSGRAFGSDKTSMVLAWKAVDRGYDLKLSKEERVFLYMPFMHAELIAEQEKGVALYQKLGLKENLDFAIRHRDIIRQFGRFPHRNALLGRDSTPEEREFLKTHSGF